MLRSVPPNGEESDNAGELRFRRSRPLLRDSEISEAFAEVHAKIMEGCVKTFAQAAAVLQLRGISFSLEVGGFGYGDSNLDDDARDLRRLLEGVQQGFHPGLVEARKTLRFIEQFPANLGTLRLLDQIDAEHVHMPYFDQLHREVSALRLIKKQEHARYFHERLRKFMEEEYDPKEALSFRYAFFGTDRAHGCGLKPEDLPLSPQERMVLNRIKLER